jgi:hypothetical protein
MRRSMVLNLPLELEVPGAAPVSFFSNVVRMVHNSEIFDAIKKMGVVLSYALFVSQKVK